MYIVQFNNMSVAYIANERLFRAYLRLLRCDKMFPVASWKVKFKEAENGLKGPETGNNGSKKKK
jgi:hypothetical protein